MKFNPSQIFALLCLAQTANAALTVSVSSSSSNWTPLGGNFDSFTDLNTADANIVGDASNPGMLFIFDDNGTPDDHTDGWLGFRIRFDKVNPNDNTKPASVVGIAIDAGANGDINAFIAYDPKAIANSPRIVLSSGTGTTPGNTSIGASAFTYDINTPISNFDYRAVVAGSDSVTDDVTTAATGDIDYYVSFLVPFADLIGVLGNGTDDRTVFRYLSYTSAQNNNINQDYGGVDGTPASTSTWVELGALSTPASVPEPSSALLTFGTLTGFLLIRRRR